MPYDSNSREWLRLCHRESMSLLGWALFATMVAGSIIQVVAIVVLAMIDPAILEQSIPLWLVTALPVYGIAMPIGFAMMKSQRVPPSTAPKAPLSPRAFFKVLLIALAALYVANIITLMITDLIGALRGMPVSNPVAALDDFPMALSIILACILAPVMEELLFRGLLLQRLRPYGDKFAILTSAIAFGLFHGTLNQVLYAFAVGVVFAYVALRTGGIWQGILLHTLINAVSTVVIPLTEGWGEMGAVALSLFILLAMAAGIVLFIRSRPSWHFEEATHPFSLKESCALFWLSGGGVFFTIVSVLTMVVTLVAE